ncbi:unnamed protein product [Natator depressus]
MGRAGEGQRHRCPPGGTGQTNQLLIQEQRWFPGPAGWGVSCGPRSLELAGWALPVLEPSDGPGLRPLGATPRPARTPDRGRSCPSLEPITHGAEPSRAPPLAPPGYEGRSRSLARESQRPCPAQAAA